MSNTLSNPAFAVAANTTSANIVTGSSLEYMQFPAFLVLGVNGSAVGLNLTFAVGDEIIVDDQPINGNNRFPINPDDMQYSSGAGSGNRIIFRLRNTTVGALTAQFLLRAKPI